MKKLELQEKVGLTVKNEALSVGNLDFIGISWHHILGIEP